MKLLFIGDIVGKPGREAMERLLPGIVDKNGIECVVANAENAAGGSGLTPSIAEELFDCGVHVLTNGDHVWKRREIIDALEVDNRILRPLNYPKGVPGSGSTIVELSSGAKIGIINLVGRVFMAAVECPFRSASEEVERITKHTPNIFIDIHAEATSEKIALGWYLDGKVTGVMGTHTHVQTADERILPKGSAYITDVGMTGPFESVIGRRKEQILKRFITQMPTRFEMADEDVRLSGAIIEFDEKIGKAQSIKRIQKQYI